ncbi:metal ABC transporter solute-binding protein, Zn/Mn family [Desulfovibrio cuneatus]|uniref:metal ABC transporter solute-binding protein, Zn/Mn family n=1 Tax=Desulfovibrio cuneatus TaxID=159728 RepID=UPI000406C570|nr:zinc ABC transporter substrate-binding protein [Desulfovibrio cuneatus]
MHMRPSSRITCLNIVAILLFLVTASLAHAAAPVKVVVSLAPQKYFLQRLAGTALEVTVLASSGSDPHTFEPSPAQMRAVAGAQVYFTIGAPFEAAWLPRIQGAAKQLRIVPLHAALEEDADHHEDEKHAEPAHKGEEKHAEPGHKDDDHDDHAEAHATDAHGHGHTGKDPHIWLSPALMLRMLDVMEKEVVALLPEKANAVTEAATALRNDIQTLQKSIHAQFAPFPAKQRLFLTFHPAWHYFAEEFGTTELSIEIDGKEPSPKAMKKVIDTALHHGLNTVFIEPQFPKSAAAMVADSIGARIVTVDPLQEDWLALLQSFSKELAASFPHVRP